jgi:cbb3-type cytochrome oxidase subunit 3
MDPSVTQGSVFTDVGVIRGLITVLTMAVYLGIFVWAYHKGNRKRFEMDALLPFADEEGGPIAATVEDDAR